MNNNDLNYDEKRREFLRIKNSGSAIRRVVKKRNEFKTWKANEVASAPGKDAGLVKLKNIVDFFTQEYIGGTQALADNQFTIEYQIYNDISREQVLGEDTIGIQVPVHWDIGEVTSFVHPAGVNQILATQWATNFYSANSNRGELSKGTGWNRDECNKVDISIVESIKDLLRVAVAGQHKLTRLVKGFLLYHDLLVNGPAEYRKTLSMDEQVQLDPTQVAGEFNQGGSAFVYSSAPDSMVHNSVCYLMASEYPTPISTTRHVVIPADAPHIKLVSSKEKRPHRIISCSITADLTMSAICKYAADFNLQGDMQQAYTIACALMQNKYLTRVSLPAVVSHIDLVPTAMLVKEKTATAPYATRDFANVVGKLFQMSCLITAKDMICAVESTTKQGLSGNQSLEMYLTHHNSTVQRTGAYATALPMLELCNDMQWLEQLDSGDMDYIREEAGAFEALWLCRDASIGVEKGLLQTMLQGVGDKTGDNKHVDRLVKELTISQVQIEAYQVPQSMFVVEGTCIHVNQKRKSRNTKWKRYDLSIKSRPVGNLPEVKMSKPLRRKNVHSSDGYTSNRSSVASPIRGMKTSRDNVDDRARDIDIEGTIDDRSPSPGVRFAPKPIEQVIAEEATGLDTRVVTVKPNIARDPTIELALDVAGRQMDGEDFTEYHTLIDRGISPDMIPYEWDKKYTSPRSAAFLVERDISAFRSQYPTAENGPEWKRAALPVMLERGMLSELLRSPSAKAMTDKLMVRELLHLDFPRGELKRLVEDRRDEMRIRREKEIEAANMVETLMARKTSFQEAAAKRGMSPKMRIIDRDESEVVEDGENFTGDPETLTIRQLFDVHESDRYKQFVKEIGAGKRFFGKDSYRGVLEWAEAAKVNTETLIMVAPMLGDTTIFQGTSPLRGDNVWREIANVEVPPMRGTSHKPMKYKRNDARVAQFYAQKQWRGLPKHIFDDIAKEYILDMDSVESMFAARSSFGRKQ